MIYLAWKQLSLKFSLICFHRVEAFGTDMAQEANMASIVLRKNRWRVQIRKQGHSYFSKTFLYKENAERRNLNPRPFVPKTSNIPILKFKKIFCIILVFVIYINRIKRERKLNTTIGQSIRTYSSHRHKQSECGNNNGGLTMRPKKERLE